MKRLLLILLLCSLSVSAGIYQRLKGGMLLKPGDILTAAEVVPDGDPVWWTGPAPVLYYHLNETSGLRSPAVGSGNLVNYGSVPSDSGLFGNAVEVYGGVDGYLHCTNTANGDVSGYTNWTINCWYNPVSSLSDGQVPLANSAYGDGQWGFYYEVGNTRFYLDLNTTSWQSHHMYASGYAENEWHMLTATWDGTYYTFYIDGSQVQQDVDTDPLNSTTYGLSIGGNNDGSQPCGGWWDEFAVWNVCLSSTWISTLYNNGAGALLQ